MPSARTRSTAIRELCVRKKKFFRFRGAPFYEGVLVKPRHGSFFRWVSWRALRGHRTPRHRIHPMPSKPLLCPAVLTLLALQHSFSPRTALTTAGWCEGRKNAAVQHRRHPGLGALRPARFPAASSGVAVAATTFYPCQPGPGQTPLTVYAHRRTAEALREPTRLLIGPLRETRRTSGGSHQVSSPASAGSLQNALHLHRVTGSLMDAVGSYAQAAVSALRPFIFTFQSTDAAPSGTTPVSK
jgi:hypothetical protein